MCVCVFVCVCVCDVTICTDLCGGSHLFYCVWSNNIYSLLLRQA